MPYVIFEDFADKKLIFFVFPLAEDIKYVISGGGFQNVAMYESENSLRYRMDKVMSITKNTHKLEEPGKGIGLACSRFIPAGFVLKDIAPPLVFRFDPCVDPAGMKYLRSMPTQHYSPIDNVFRPSLMEKCMQAFLPCIDSQNHLDGNKPGEVCANAGCSKCGLHPTTIAALSIANFPDFLSSDSAYHKWLKFLCVDTGIISRSLQFYEIIFITDFILKEEKIMIQEGQGHQIAAYAMYVWNVVGVFKSCAFSLYAPITTEKNRLYDTWKLDMKSACEAFLAVPKTAATIQLKIQLGAAVKNLEKDKPQEPRYYEACFLSLHPNISYINGSDIMTKPNVEMQQSLKNKGTLPILNPENITYFLETIRDLKEGEFLTIDYNKDDNAYFEMADQLSLWSIVSKHDEMRLNLSLFLRKYSTKLPGYVQALIEGVR